MKFAILVYPGSNCDHDCYHVVKHVMGEEAEYVWHKEKSLSGFDGVIVPGGFSYGDYLRAGAIANFSPITNELKTFAEKGGLVLGICNGFQILCEAGILPGALTRNKDQKFICDTVGIKVENNSTKFTSSYKEGAVVELPIAHADGSYYADLDTIKSLEDNSQVIFRYCSASGEITTEANPNGSLGNIAGITNKRGNVLGMMPHPERASERELGSKSGKAVFDSILNALK
ncbi:MAG: phosphoribosylformylglycinamidine synthase subunit PurQ [Deltaproteobacteria bacterium]|nr:phosphoribosylformylglycinamidine synthase subunit PurQ [Deltaproteobacteria bacterium]